MGDLAAHFGCAVGISDALTAITGVALGTSLPDTFASKQAAVEDPYADAAVGNVTGSNAVNVFLGLGLPWVIGALHCAGTANDPACSAESGNYVMIAGTLNFSVMVFTLCA